MCCELLHSLNTLWLGCNCILAQWLIQQYSTYITVHFTDRKYRNRHSSALYSTSTITNHMRDSLTKLFEHHM